ncbi:MAG: hypothetical protein ABEJ68_01670 [Halobacteriaceae archaeon]
MVPVAQSVAPAAGDVTAYVGTLLLAWAFFTFTAQIATTYFLGDVPWRRAAVVGVVPAVVTMALIRYPPALILGIALAADFAAVHGIYRLRYRTAALVTLGHIVASVALAVPLANLFELFTTAPG